MKWLYTWWPLVTFHVCFMLVTLFLVKPFVSVSEVFLLNEELIDLLIDWLIYWLPPVAGIKNWWYWWWNIFKTYCNFVCHVLILLCVFIKYLLLNEYNLLFHIWNLKLTTFAYECFSSLTCWSTQAVLQLPYYSSKFMGSNHWREWWFVTSDPNRCLCVVYIFVLIGRNVDRHTANRKHEE